MQDEERELEPDSALEWLNDWCGRRVMVAGRLRGALIFEAEGELRHAANVGDPGRVRMEDYAGRYCVGFGADVVQGCGQGAPPMPHIASAERR
jgi:hypothetical protein